MENETITCRVLTFCSNISEKAYKISSRNNKVNNNKHPKDKKDIEVTKDGKEPNVTLAEEDKGHRSNYLKDAFNNAHYILTLEKGENSQYKPEATDLHGPKEASKNLNTMQTQKSKKKKVIEDNVITTQPKLEKESKQFVNETLNDIIMKQPQKRNARNKVNCSHGKKLGNKVKKDNMNGEASYEQESIKTLQPRKKMSIKYAKYYFMRNQNKKTKDQTKQNTKIIQNVAQDFDHSERLAKGVNQKNKKETASTPKEDKIVITPPNISKSKENFYFNRSDSSSQRRVKVKSNTKKHTKKKNCITQKNSRSIHLFKIPSKLPVKRKKSTAKTINLDYFRRKMSFHVNSSSFNSNKQDKQITKKTTPKVKCKIQESLRSKIQESLRNLNDDVHTLFNRQACKQSTSSKKDIPIHLQRSHSSDVFGFRKSNRSKNMVYYKCNKRRSLPNMPVKVCRSMEYQNLLHPNAPLPCFAKKVKQVICDKCRRKPKEIVCPRKVRPCKNIQPEVCLQKIPSCKELTPDVCLRQVPSCKEIPADVCLPKVASRKEIEPEVRPPKVIPPKPRVRPPKKVYPKLVPCPVRPEDYCQPCNRKVKSCNRIVNLCKELPCENKFKMVEFPCDGMGDNIAVYRLKAASRKKKSEKTCNKTCDAKYSRKICCGAGDDEDKEEKDFHHDADRDADHDEYVDRDNKGVDPCDSSNMKPESALTITIRSCLICMVMICWLPCILLVFLCWLITYPMRPHARESKEKKPILETFVCWVKNAKWFNLSFLDVFWSMTHEHHSNQKLDNNQKLEKSSSMRHSPAPEKERTREPPSICCLKMETAKDRCKSLFPNKDRQYTLAHTTSRGWVMRPLREERMPPSILKKEGQRSRSQRNMNFGGGPCPPCPKREAVKVSRRCQAGMQGICVEQRIPEVQQAVVTKSTKCSCSQVTPKTSTGITCTCTPPKSAICTCGNRKNASVCSTKAVIGVCRPKPRPTCKCKISAWKKCYRNCRNACRDFTEFEKGNYNPNASCADLYYSTQSKKPCCFWMRECCPNMYPFIAQMCSMYTNCCRGLLLLLSACIWIPWMLCCYLCLKCLCACFGS